MLTPAEALATLAGALGSHSISFLLCPLCNTFREATTDNFYASHVNGKPNEWFASMPHSYNLGAYGCNTCRAQQLLLKQSVGDEYLKVIGQNYPSIWHWYTNTEYREANGRELSRVPQSDSGLAYLRKAMLSPCPVSGTPLNGIKGSPFCVGVEASVKLQEGPYDRWKDHELENIRGTGELPRRSAACLPPPSAPFWDGMRQWRRRRWHRFCLRTEKLFRIWQALAFARTCA